MSDPEDKGTDPTTETGEVSPEDSGTSERSETLSPQERAERRANRIRIGSMIVDVARMGWEMFTHKW